MSNTDIMRAEYIVGEWNGVYVLCGKRLLRPVCLCIHVYVCNCVVLSSLYPPNKECLWFVSDGLTMMASVLS